NKPRPRRARPDLQGGGGRDNRILVVAQHILDSFRPLQILAGPLGPGRSRELRRVAGALDRLSHVVELGVRGIPWQPPRLAPDAPVLPRDRLRQRPRSAEPRLLDGM